MSNLISKSARDLIGIDSPWRGIVWAALMLRAGNVHSDRVGNDPNYPYTNAVRIAGGRQVVSGGLQSFLTIEATLPYNSPEALADAGDFLPFVGEYFEGSVPGYTGSACSTLNGLGYPYSGIGEEMPEDDPAVDSLEKYLVWCFLLGELELLNPTPNALLPIFLDFLEEAPGGASLKLSAKLFIDFHGYRACNNLVCSVFPPSVIPAVIPPPDPGLDIEWTDILNKPDFAIVAMSGDYDDLEDRPTIPTKTSQLENDSNFLDEINYPVTSVNGLTGAVQITAAIGQAEWANVLNKPDFAEVATSGDYADLVNPPTIPTKTSDLENDSNFLTQVTYPVTSVNGMTGAVVLDLIVNWDGVQDKPTFSTVAFSGSYSDLTNKPTIPPSGGSSGAGILEAANNSNLVASGWYWVKGEKTLNIPTADNSVDQQVIFIKVLPESNITFSSGFGTFLLTASGEYRLIFTTFGNKWKLYSIYSTTLIGEILASVITALAILNFTGNTSTGQTTEDLFYWLGTNQLTTSWQHPNDINKTTTSQANTVVGGAPAVIDRNTNTSTATDATAAPWWRFDLLTVSFNITRFRLKKVGGQDPANFTLQGSNDSGNTWTDLFTEPTANWSNDWYDSGLISSTIQYTSFRIAMTGNNVDNYKLMRLQEAEFFGNVY
jgi:hypothetical protein